MPGSRTAPRYGKAVEVALELHGCKAKLARTKRRRGRHRSCSSAWSGASTSSDQREADHFSPLPCRSWVAEGAWWRGEARALACGARGEQSGEGEHGGGRNGMVATWLRYCCCLRGEKGEMGRAGRQSAAQRVLESDTRVRGPLGRQVPAAAVRRRPRGGLPLPWSGATRGRGRRAG
jgi:hypothetical protein